MGKQSWKPGNMLYPLPVVMVSVADKNGEKNIFTVAWAGTVCSDPPMVSISVRPERYSYHMIEETGEFVINLTTEKLTYATDYCGVRSGSNIDKFKELGLTAAPADVVRAPLLVESPVNIECVVKEIKKLGTHDMFIAQVVAVHADEEFMDEKNKFHFEAALPIVYSHGAYMSLGKQIGTFGYSVKKK
ncbi:flavin reductase (DIM6/NTAB) family NADH-FMN oxidoreductase RutF [Kineothrix alysoides]|uniref:Flavin reductase (DIM6/NTAB) family NADH-FMN oxidoreductase RutF n=1 Tax=Kineothrix alysoides TaxID=1469948 RepID=A0A4R1R6W3_9FIRM|nr:flavin reductase family protein [Kineothrix alysoides]TCL61209.1 flavin reductase (DIM6/NTAB) family NADH-FMN oxidoreductase RutF [Kineothrix alysoides]